jgi:hypothetical protein
MRRRRSSSHAFATEAPPPPTPEALPPEVPPTPARHGHLTAPLRVHLTAATSPSLRLIVGRQC